MTASMSMVFCCGCTLLFQVAVHGSAKISMAATSETPTPPIQPGHRLITQRGTHASRGMGPLIVQTLTSTAPPTLSLPPLETSAAAAKQVSRKLYTNGMLFEKLVQNTRPNTTESPPHSGEYVAIIILSILCGIVLMMIIIYTICKHRCCRVRFHVVTLRCDELSSSEVSLESGLPDGQINMASVPLDASRQTSTIATDVENSSHENAELEESAQDPSSQDMRQNNVSEFRHAIPSDYMDLSYFTSKDNRETDTLKQTECVGPGAGDVPATKDDKSKSTEDPSSSNIRTYEASVVHASDRPATGTLKRPKLLYDKYGYTLVTKNGDKQFQIAEDSGHTVAVKDHPQNHGVFSKVGHNATVNSPVSKHKIKTFHENVLLPKTELVERLIGSSQTDLHDEAANHSEDLHVSPKIETHALDHYLDLYSQIDEDSCGINGEMDLVENLSTETEGQQSDETYLENTDTDIEHVSGCTVSNTTTASRLNNVLLQSLDILQGLQETTPTTDAISDYHSSGEDTSPEEDIDIMAYLGDYVPPKKTYLGIIYEYEEDIEFDETDRDISDEGDFSEMEESSKEQINKEHANSLKQESDRIKTCDTMIRVITAKQEWIEDEDTVGKSEILQKRQMNDKRQTDAEEVQKKDQAEAEAESPSVDKQTVDEDLTVSCNKPLDYQELIQTTEGVDPFVHRDDHTSPQNIQGTVMYSQDTGNMDVQRDETLVVAQGVKQEVVQEVAHGEVQEVSSEKLKEQREELEKGALELEEVKMEDECNKLGKTEKLEDEELMAVQLRGNQQLLDVPDDTVEQVNGGSVDILLGNTLADVNSNLRYRKGEEEETQSGTGEKKQEENLMVREDRDDVVHDVVIEQGEAQFIKEENILEGENEGTLKFQNVEFRERGDEQVKEDEDLGVRPDSIIDKIVKEADNDKPGNEQVLEGQDEMTETGTSQHIPEGCVRGEDQPKEDEVDASIEMDGAELEKHADEAEKEKCIENSSYGTAELESQITDIANSTKLEPFPDDDNGEVQQSEDEAVQEKTTESVIHLKTKNEVPGENLQQDDKMKENDDKEHEATENKNNLCEESKDMVFLDAEEEGDEEDEEDDDDDDGWMQFDEPISMVLSACQFSGSDDGDSEELDYEGDRSFDTNFQYEGAHVLDNCLARDYIERLQFLQPTKGILCKEGESGENNGGKGCSKKVRFTLQEEWNTC